ncbi:hypothetical protein AJ80_09852 [Polytolypa hystricis UAMH7299]|uniref:Subtelomeric hrmA-associated cluster protein AFUB-079030/YDR124W-like helical bundle domain-containing protein n=1 Tax=Polytolypa hystricis (strain UAMH7299) TaxID=1447883 RepID=A0A2B7WI52_POLH7|nr:hypothetical protein AJ80_09852 [Polytolypa hystricis UAMH7299]
MVKQPVPISLPFKDYFCVYVDDTGQIRYSSSLSLQTGHSHLEDFKKWFADALQMVPGYDTKSPKTRPPEDLKELKIGDEKILDAYYTGAFKVFQQLNCRQLAKAWIRLIEPRKQVKYPYNGGKGPQGNNGDPEKTKPGWWPAGVPHREPDHLLKAARIKLLVHILHSHEVTADQLEQAGRAVHHLIEPKEKRQVVEEIYRVRRAEEEYERGIDPTPVYVCFQKSMEPETDTDPRCNRDDFEIQPTKRPFEDSEASLNNTVSPQKQRASNVFPFPMPTSTLSPVAQPFNDIKENCSPGFSHFRAPSPSDLKPSTKHLGFTQPGCPPSPVDDQIQWGLQKSWMSSCHPSWANYQQVSNTPIIFATPGYDLMSQRVSMIPTTKEPAPILITGPAAYHPSSELTPFAQSRYPYLYPPRH